MAVKFYLKKQVDGMSLIMLTFSFNYQRFRASTGLRIKPKNWSKGKAVSNWEFKAEETNVRLGQIRLFLENEYRKQLNDGITPTPETLRNPYLTFIGKKVEERVDLHTYVKRYNDKMKKRYNWRTLNSYQLLAKRLKDYESATGNRADFDVIGKQFYNDFRDYLGSISKKLKDGEEKHLKDVSAAKMFKCLKRVLNQALEDGITNCTEQKKEYFKVFDEPADSVYLTIPEIESLYQAEIPDHFLKYKIDRFILACFTGLRFSDWGKLTPAYLIEGGKFLNVLTYKTGELVIIPLHPIAKEIIEKYRETGYVLPSNQKMNKTLKQIGQFIDMTQTIIVSSTFRGMVTTVLRRKCELITTHTARRSFATNAFLSGIPTISIMKITGHKTERSFLRYIRVSQLENAMKLADHPFFSSYLPTPPRSGQ